MKKTLFRLGLHLQRHLIIRLVLHHLMMQEELVLVFQDAHFDAQLHRNPGFAFADPFGVRFKEEETFSAYQMPQRISLFHLAGFGRVGLSDAQIILMRTDDESFVFEHLLGGLSIRITGR